MSDNNPPDDSENNEAPIPEANEQLPMPEQDLERVFQEWGQKRSDFLGTDSNDDDAADFGDVDDEGASQAQLRLDKSRKAVNSRLILLIVLTTVGAATFVINWSDINYYFVSESDRVNLGDLRE
ncbi:MAG TPA: hypothetical protein EYN06_06625, partial [Myxococcales bacterium]|nr:hypothetical protein [Myxococcales bacterium]